MTIGSLTAPVLETGDEQATEVALAAIRLNLLDIVSQQFRHGYLLRFGISIKSHNPTLELMAVA